MERDRKKNLCRRWSDQEVDGLLSIFLDQIQKDPSKYEKPTLQKYYKKILNETPMLKRTNMQWTAVRNKMHYLKGQYQRALEWREENLNELSSIPEDEAIFRLQEICPHFEKLDIILSLRPNATAPNPTDGDSRSDSASTQMMFKTEPVVYAEPCSGNPLELSAEENELPSMEDEESLETGSPPRAKKTRGFLRPKRQADLLPDDTQEVELQLRRAKWEWKKELRKKRLELKISTAREVEELRARNEHTENMQRIQLEHEQQMARVAADERIRKFEIEMKFKARFSTDA